MLERGACVSRVISYVAVDSSAAAPIDVQIEPRHIASARGVRDRSERGPPHCDFGPIQKGPSAARLSGWRATACGNVSFRCARICAWHLKSSLWIEKRLGCALDS